MIEYYRYKTTSSIHFTEGKIYKSLNPEILNVHSNFIDDLGGINGHFPNNDQYFEPSTEYEYNEQNNISNKEKDVDYSYLISLFDKFNTI